MLLGHLHASHRFRVQCRFGFWASQEAKSFLTRCLFVDRRIKCDDFVCSLSMQPKWFVLRASNATQIVPVPHFHKKNRKKQFSKQPEPHFFSASCRTIWQMVRTTSVSGCPAAPQVPQATKTDRKASASFV